jgi:hypothetical protein
VFILFLLSLQAKSITQHNDEKNNPFGDIPLRCHLRAGTAACHSP